MYCGEDLSARSKKLFKTCKAKTWWVKLTRISVAGLVATKSRTPVTTSEKRSIAGTGTPENVDPLDDSPQNSDKGSVSGNDSDADENESELSLLGKYRCGHCCFLGTSYPDIFEHIGAHILYYVPYTCGNCNMGFCTQSQISNHRNTTGHMSLLLKDFRINEFKHFIEIQGLKDVDRRPWLPSKLRFVDCSKPDYRPVEPDELYDPEVYPSLDCEEPVTATAVPQQTRVYRPLVRVASPSASTTALPNVTPESTAPVSSRGIPNARDVPNEQIATHKLQESLMQDLSIRPCRPDDTARPVPHMPDDFFTSDSAIEDVKPNLSDRVNNSGDDSEEFKFALPKETMNPVNSQSSAADSLPNKAGFATSHACEDRTISVDLKPDLANRHLAELANPIVGTSLENNARKRSSEEMQGVHDIRFKRKKFKRHTSPKKTRRKHKKSSVANLASSLLRSTKKNLRKRQIPNSPVKAKLKSFSFKRSPSFRSLKSKKKLITASKPRFLPSVFSSSVSATVPRTKGLSINRTDSPRLFSCFSTPEPSANSVAYNFNKNSVNFPLQSSNENLPEIAASTSSNTAFQALISAQESRVPPQTTSAHVRTLSNLVESFAHTPITRQLLLTPDPLHQPTMTSLAAPTIGNSVTSEPLLACSQPPSQISRVSSSQGNSSECTTLLKPRPRQSSHISPGSALSSAVIQSSDKPVRSNAPSLRPVVAKPVKKHHQLTPDPLHQPTMTSLAAPTIGNSVTSEPLLACSQPPSQISRVSSSQGNSSECTTLLKPRPRQSSHISPGSALSSAVIQSSDKPVRSNAPSLRPVVAKPVKKHHQSVAPIVTSSESVLRNERDSLTQVTVPPMASSELPNAGSRDSSTNQFSSFITNIRQHAHNLSLLLGPTSSVHTSNLSRPSETGILSTVQPQFHRNERDTLTHVTVPPLPSLHASILNAPAPSQFDKFSCFTTNFRQHGPESNTFSTSVQSATVVARDIVRPPKKPTSLPVLPTLAHLLQPGGDGFIAPASAMQQSTRFVSTSTVQNGLAGIPLYAANGPPCRFVTPNNVQVGLPPTCSLVNTASIQPQHADLSTGHLYSTDSSVEQVAYGTRMPVTGTPHTFPSICTQYDYNNRVRNSAIRPQTTAPPPSYRTALMSICSVDNVRFQTNVAQPQYAQSNQGQELRYRNADTCNQTATTSFTSVNPPGADINTNQFTLIGARTPTSIPVTSVQRNVRQPSESRSYPEVARGQTRERLSGRSGLGTVPLIHLPLTSGTGAVNSQSVSSTISTGSVSVYVPCTSSSASAPVISVGSPLDGLNDGSEISTLKFVIVPALLPDDVLSPREQKIFDSFKIK